jgi:hypothetical protein
MGGSGARRIATVAENDLILRPLDRFVEQSEYPYFGMSAMRGP